MTPNALKLDNLSCLADGAHVSLMLANKQIMPNFTKLSQL